MSLLGSVITSVASRRATTPAAALAHHNDGVSVLRRSRSFIEWSAKERQELVVEQTVVLKTMQALLNLSSIPALQVPICNIGVDLLLYVLQAKISHATTKLAKRLLANLATNKANTTVYVCVVCGSTRTQHCGWCVRNSCTGRRHGGVSSSMYKAELHMHAPSKAEAHPGKQQQPSQRGKQQSTARRARPKTASAVRRTGCRKNEVASRYSEWFNAVRHDGVDPREAASLYVALVAGCVMCLFVRVRVCVV